MTLQKNNSYRGMLCTIVRCVCFVHIGFIDIYSHGPWMMLKLIHSGLNRYGG